MPSISRKRPPPERIGLFGLFGSGNSGNDGSLEAMLIFLRQVRPDAELACICPTPNKVQEEFGVAGVAAVSPGSGAVVRLLNRLSFGTLGRLANWIYAIRWMRKFDLLVIPGTGILDDFGTGPWQIPYWLFRWCLSARLCGSEIWFVSIGAGPIHHPMSRRLMKWAAAMAAYRSYRDAISKEFMESIGLNVRSDRVYPDLAFKLQGPDCSRPRRSDGEDLTVGVGVMNYSGWRSDLEHRADFFDAYLKKLTRFVVWLLNRGYRIRILTGHTFDQLAVDAFVKALARERGTIEPERLFAEPAPTLHDLMREISLTDIVVATRFHNVVCALKLGKPTISIEYANKNRVLLADMGLGNFCQHIEKLDVDLLIEQFIALVDDRQQRAQRIERTVRNYQRQLACQDAFLASRLLPRLADELPEVTE
jgi:polysaccharide pyruvyl transferase WcaK-like protein